MSYIHAMHHSRIFPLPILLFLALLCINAFWAVNAADFKVGFVNIPTIMAKAPQAKSAREKLQQEFSSRRREIESCSREIEDLDQMLRRDGRSMEKSRRDRMIDKARKENRECDGLKEEFEADFNRRRGEVLKELEQQISKIIKNIAQRQDIKLIVGPPVVYIDEQMNLTEEVLDALSRESR